MYPKTVPDQPLQQKLLENMYKFKASSPVIVDDAPMPDRGEVDNHLSLCDTIHMGSQDGGQTMEVIEHILHITTNAGFHHTWPTEWAIGTTRYM